MTRQQHKNAREKARRMKQMEIAAIKAGFLRSGWVYGSRRTERLVAHGLWEREHRWQWLTEQEKNAEFARALKLVGDTRC